MVQFLTGIHNSKKVLKFSTRGGLKRKKKGEFVDSITYILNFATNVKKQTIHESVDETKCIFSPSFRQHILDKETINHNPKTAICVSIHTQRNKTQCKSSRNSMTLSLKNIITSTSAPNFTLKKLHVNVVQYVKKLNITQR